MSSSETGLCSTCAHARVIPAERTTFYICKLSKDNTQFRKYPVLPVFQCEGHLPSK